MRLIQGTSGNDGRSRSSGSCGRHVPGHKICGELYARIQTHIGHPTPYLYLGVDTEHWKHVPLQLATPDFTHQQLTLSGHLHNVRQ